MPIRLIAVFIVLIVASILLFDQPIAHFVHDHLRQKNFLDPLTHIVDILAPLSAVILILGGFAALGGIRLAGWMQTALRCALAYMVSAGLKLQLKILFGRYWPETWTHDNPSLIGTGDYGFHFFRIGPAFESFPSGHTTAITSVMTVLWLAYPRFRLLYAVLVLSVIIGLLGMDYHFVSDILAGCLLGGLTGLAVWRMAR